MLRLGAAFLGLNVLDIVLTLCIVGGGAGVELNPVMAWMLNSTAAAVAFKTVVPAAIAAGLIIIHRNCVTPMFSPKTVLVALVAVEAGVCVFNLSGIVGGLP